MRPTDKQLFSISTFEINFRSKQMCNKEMRLELYNTIMSGHFYFISLTFDSFNVRTSQVASYSSIIIIISMSGMLDLNSILITSLLSHTEI